jgi:hypothetical protein
MSILAFNVDGTQLLNEQPVGNWVRCRSLFLDASIPVLRGAVRGATRENPTTIVVNEDGPARVRR